MNQLLNEDVTQQVREAFEGIQHPVEVLFFGQKEACDYCGDTRQLIEEVVAISDKLSLKSYDLQEDADVAEKFNIDKAPGLIIAAKEGSQVTDYGVHYAGIPSGHEFSSLIQDILLVSNRDSGLSPQTREFLKGLSEPLILQVFVTPTCPYCPRAVVLAHMMAMESPLVQAEMVESMEFQQLASQFGVSGVPHTIVNSGKGNVIGAVPEGNLLAEIQRALGRQEKVI
jgi:glutaredoxin-like protein